VVSVKLEEAETAKKRRETKEKKQRLLEILADKQDEEIKGKSIEELTQMINELGA